MIIQHDFILHDTEDNFTMDFNYFQLQFNSHISTQSPWLPNSWLTDARCHRWSWSWNLRSSVGFSWFFVQPNWCENLPKGEKDARLSNHVWSENVYTISLKFKRPFRLKTSSSLQRSCQIGDIMNFPHTVYTAGKPNRQTMIQKVVYFIGLHYVENSQHKFSATSTFRLRHLSHPYGQSKADG